MVKGKEPSKKKKERKNKSKKKVDKKRISGYEVFDIKDSKGNTKEELAPFVEENKDIQPKEEKHQEKILYYFFITFGIFLILSISLFYIFNSQTSFNYKGIKFNIINQGKITFYNTQFHKSFNNKNINYNIFLRNDPRVLEKVPFEGGINISHLLFVNVGNNLACNGYGTIAIANMAQIFGFMGTKLVTVDNSNETCDKSGRYLFLRVQSSNRTDVEEFSPNCYNLNVKNCEVLKPTERFILEYYLKYLK